MINLGEANPVPSDAVNRVIPRWRSCMVNRPFLSVRTVGMFSDSPLWGTGFLVRTLAPATGCPR